MGVSQSNSGEAYIPLLNELRNNCEEIDRLIADKERILTSRNRFGSFFSKILPQESTSPIDSKMADLKGKNIAILNEVSNKIHDDISGGFDLLSSDNSQSIGDIILKITDEFNNVFNEDDFSTIRKKLYTLVTDNIKIVEKKKVEVVVDEILEQEPSLERGSIEVSVERLFRTFLNDLTWQHIKREVSEEDPLLDKKSGNFSITLANSGTAYLHTGALLGEGIAKKVTVALKVTADGCVERVAAQSVKIVDHPSKFVANEENIAREVNIVREIQAHAPTTNVIMPAEFQFSYHGSRGQKLFMPAKLLFFRWR